MPAHYWTASEANAALPELRRILSDMLAARERILLARPEIWPVLEKAIGNGGSRLAGEMVQEFERIQRGIERVRAMGVILKDLNAGLVDFLSRRDGREVFLCWRYDEEDVQFWHELDAGFGGRQPL
ncbi:MAG: DUF2203 domain-containing protein [Chloroflexi bacterium]|nr:DUF2203 domain-containing protein [Chloroflexota bacterium]